MSLLMKALEKAAQDRDKIPASPSLPPAVPGAARELKLEAIDVLAEAAGAVEPKPNIKAQTFAATQARAANVFNASVTPSPGASAAAWLMARPVYWFGGLATLFLLGYGTYVYLQIAHPGLLLKSLPPAPATAPTPTPTPAPAVPQPLATQTLQDATQRGFVALPPALSGRGDAIAQGAPRAAASPAPATGSAAGSAPAPVTTPAPPVAVALATRVSVSRSDSTTPRLNPIVSEAYAALEARHFDTAQRLYTQVLRSEPSNVDALLGLASIAQHDQRPEDAQRYFMTILEGEPRHALAQSGLITLLSRVDPQAAESRLKQLLAREPSAPLHFNLGNIYAEQGQWSQAQQAYFQAHALDPRNAEYAYNLAVGLDHLGQQKIALEYYRKALQLASAKGNAHFDAARTQERIAQLAARLN